MRGAITLTALAASMLGVIAMTGDQPDPLTGNLTIYPTAAE